MLTRGRDQKVGQQGPLAIRACGLGTAPVLRVSPLVVSVHHRSWSFCHNGHLGFYIYRSSPKDIFPLIFREIGRERERQREISMCEKHIHWLPPACTPTRTRPQRSLQLRYVPLIRTEPKPQANALSTKPNQLGQKIF
uniref:Uncharacterized protein n=1 Tax=Myotis myotis TaxID=51298 RepID=A0A7J7Y0A2_MYOMY|nr:hypothetical protein mMyoMyo1_011533 [Myotis myotis]